MVTFRSASVHDVTGIIEVKRSVWPDEENADLDYILSVIEQPEHSTLVAELDGQIIGFVDGFSTLSADSVYRWEIDLLAVHPAQHRRGIASELIRLSCEAGVSAGMMLARALIHRDNLPSERAFLCCGFSLMNEMGWLYTASAKASEDNFCLCLEDDDHLIPVTTLNYRGIWIEGGQTTNSLIIARHMCSVHGLDVAGLVTVRTDDAKCSELEAHGYQQVGPYRYFTMRL